MIEPFVYIMASGDRGTLYVGVTSELKQRVAQHKTGHFKGFTSKYRVENLVWCERHDTMEHAIAREKQLKKWRRIGKVRLIESLNPEWRDLFPTIP